ncbi:MAG TPA: hypothetical protein VJL08_04630, partial [Dehalococcoidia bacterium]|nr:hypothetical protein [Dehalococcoidia bacterium]
MAAGAGATGGTILQGKVIGEVPVAVSQALLVGAPIWKASLPAGGQPQQIEDNAALVSMPNRYIATVSKERTGFQAAAELATGDWAAFNLPLKNASKVALVAVLTLDVPDGLEVEVYASTASSHIRGVVRLRPKSWL